MAVTNRFVFTSAAAKESKQSVRKKYNNCYSKRCKTSQNNEPSPPFLKPWLNHQNTPRTPNSNSLCPLQKGRQVNESPASLSISPPFSLPPSLYWGSCTLWPLRLWNVCAWTSGCEGRWWRWGGEEKGEGGRGGEEGPELVNLRDGGRGEEGRSRFFSLLQKLSGGTISMENGVCPGRHWAVLVCEPGRERA